VTWLGGNVEALLATLFLSRGTMMITAGDEFGRTQNGNNNAYCQDNALTWLNWLKADQNLIAFTSNISALREKLQDFLQDEFVKPEEGTWFGADGKAFNWNQPQNRFLGLVLTRDQKRTAIVLNAGDAVKFASPTQKKWKRIFCSGDGAECAARAVSVFEEI